MATISNLANLTPATAVNSRSSSSSSVVPRSFLNFRGFDSKLSSSQLSLRFNNHQSRPSLLEFGSHVKFWTTINEANIFTIGGYNDGTTPPGRCSSPGRNCSSGNSSTEPYIVGHNLLLAHASASRLYKQKYKEMQGGSVGFSLFAIGFIPFTSSKDDDIASQRAKDFFFDWLLRPLIFGDYPDDMKRTVGSRLPVFSEEESEQVKGSSDFIGIIHYLAASVTNAQLKTCLSRNPDFYSDMGVSMTLLGNFSAFEYAVAPWAMENVLEYIKESYGNPPVYILENGRPLKQDLTLQQKDTPRIEYLDAYIGAVLKSVSDPHLKRSPKLSAHWYSAFLKGNTTFLGSQGNWRANTTLPQLLHENVTYYIL
ncbi:unnamed protein product [Microthlaspi erraticum]|uniref:beta-glucosidase n=1 Tax=Microthlaspi erraticum TaxID=1685480 RepID=A0A6D2J101_9BRAS|nr:unnamed protein product [Microthlaspi erraticum]